MNSIKNKEIELVRAGNFNLPATVVFFFLCFTISSCTNLLDKNSSHNAIGENFGDESKQKGTHLFGRIDSANIQGFKETNIEWLALVPWGFQENYQSANVRYHRGDSLQIKRRDSSWLRQINIAQASGYKVFFKPHIWLQSDTNNTWRSDIYPKNNEDWVTWKNTYRDFILRCAKIAEKADAQLFCVGVEFTALTASYPEYWKSLIAEIRTVYSGKLTYAANWYKEYEKVSFWDDLDYIGIQAYFPLSENDSPSTQEITEGWKNHLLKIEALSKKYKKKVLFTELGYKSTKDSAREPWKWVEYSKEGKENICFETQANCYTAFFNTVWPKEWLAGLYIWQMRGDHKPEHSEECTDFTPQSKPAEEIIKQGYSSL